MCDEKRVFHENFWWDLVRPSKEKVGSDRAKDKEEVKEDDNVQRLFDFLAAGYKENDYGEFDLDNASVDNDTDGEASVVSSTMGSCEDEQSVLLTDDTEWDFQPEEDWETMNESERETTINGNLKVLGNVKKKRMSPLILTDLLGDDAIAALAQLKTKHLTASSLMPYIYGHFFLGT